jgi:folate-binding protein YgfZ
VKGLVFHRPDAGVVTVEGPDAVSFLQSLVSQDLEPLADGEWTRSLLLQPQGKLTAVFDARRVSPEYVVLVTDEGYGPVLADALNRFRIRVKAEVVDRTGEWDVYWRTDGAPLAGPRGEVAYDGDTLDAGAYERWRIANGRPRLGVDIDDTTIPQEAFLERDAVSFTKGCFLGQELVCRIDTRGHVNRFLRRLELDDAVPVTGAEVVAGGKTVGTVTSVVPNGDGAIALALVRREVEPPASVIVRWNGTEAAARVTSD